MAAFLPSPNPSDSDSEFEIDIGSMDGNPWELPSSVPINPQSPPPQTPRNQINVKKLILYNELYYERLCL